MIELTNIINTSDLKAIKTQAMWLVQRPQTSIDQDHLVVMGFCVYHNHTHFDRRYGDKPYQL